MEWPVQCHVLSLHACAVDTNSAIEESEIVSKEEEEERNVSAALLSWKEPLYPFDRRLGGRLEEKILDPNGTRTPTPWSPSL
jgi:hypothetical protein